MVFSFIGKFVTIYIGKNIGVKYMTLQNFEKKNLLIDELFKKRITESGKPQTEIKLSWSNWGFGLEDLDTSLKRLKRAKIDYVELHGNQYGSDLGYTAKETLKILNNNDMKVSGICGMFSDECELASPSGIVRQNALDYLKRIIDFTYEVGGDYILVVPGAVGRSKKYDDSEIERSTATLRLVADRFSDSGIRAAIEPIRSAEVSFCHTVKDAKEYITKVNHPGIAHINGDLYHMQSEESHIGIAIVESGDMLTNLHLADSNRCALGDGFMDIDTIIKALYAIFYEREKCYLTPEPLGPGGNPYPAMNNIPDSETLDKLVNDTAAYFYARNAEILS